MVSKEIKDAIDEIVQATRDLEVSRRFHGHATIEADEMSLEDEKAALIALLARDDARIARLEDVAKAVKGCMLFAPQDGDSGATELYDDYWRELNDALAALDEDAPGGG